MLLSNPHSIGGRERQYVALLNHRARHARGQSFDVLQELDLVIAIVVRHIPMPFGLLFRWCQLRVDISTSFPASMARMDVGHLTERLDIIATACGLGLTPKFVSITKETLFRW